jgi:erythromycin esterase-like protein
LIDCSEALQHVGELARKRYGGESVLIGFTTFGGHVTAASSWGDPPQRKWVRPALHGSHEALLHEVGEVGAPNFWLPTAEPLVYDTLRMPRLERAIGVIYRPETERRSH